MSTLIDGLRRQVTELRAVGGVRELHVLAVEVEPHRVDLHRVVGTDGAERGEQRSVEQIAQIFRDRGSHLIDNLSAPRGIPLHARYRAGRMGRAERRRPRM